MMIIVTVKFLFINYLDLKIDLLKIKTFKKLELIPSEIHFRNLS